MTELSEATARLREFRRSWGDDDQVCEDCGLTADDLDVILLALEPRDKGQTAELWRKAKASGGEPPHDGKAPFGHLPT